MQCTLQNTVQPGLHRFQLVHLSDLSSAKQRRTTASVHTMFYHPHHVWTTPGNYFRDLSLSLNTRHAVGRWVVGEFRVTK